MEKTNSKAIEIPLYFHNYKLLKEKRFLLKGSAIYFIQGPNRVGKTSFLNAIAAIQGAKETTKEPVTRGKEDGYNEFIIPGADGKTYTIRHSFDNKRNKFIAIDEEGNKISSVTDIRKIFNYTHFTVNDFFRLSMTSEGRRKQKEIILQLLTEKEKTRYSELDDLESVRYNERTSVNSNKEAQEVILENNKVTDEDLKSLEKLEEIEKDIAKYGACKSRLHELDKDISYDDEKIKEVRAEIEHAEYNLKTWKEALKYREETLFDNKTSLKKLEEELDVKLLIDNKVQVLEFDEVCSQLNTNKTALQGISYKKKSYDDSTEKLKEIKLEWNKLNEAIEDTRNEKSEIISKSDLPLDNISFEDGYLTVDGYTFTEDQVCESDGVMLVAKIMSEINPGPIQLIGDASILDFDRLEELNKIAEDRGKVLFVDEVVRDLKNIRVVGYEDIKDEIKKNSLKSNSDTKSTSEDHKVSMEKTNTESTGEKEKSEEIQKSESKDTSNPEDEKSTNKSSDKIFENAKKKYKESLGKAIKETGDYINGKAKEQQKEKDSQTESEEFPNNQEETDLF